MHYERHALDVVKRFQSMLEGELVEQIGIDHFQELETLIAAALGVVDSQARYEVVNRFETVLSAVKKEASQVDSDYLADLKDGD